MNTVGFWERHPLLDIYLNFWTRLTACLLPLIAVGSIIEYGFTLPAISPILLTILIGQLLLPLLHLLLLAFLGNFN